MKLTNKSLLSAAFAGLGCLLIFIGGQGCTEKSQEVSQGEKRPAVISEFAQVEGSGVKSAPQPGVQQLAEGSTGQTMDEHPGVQVEEKIERDIFVPDNVRGKWKAVKILIRHKKNEEKNETRTIALGSSFVLAGSQMKVTVGPFFPNFVMNQNLYSSVNNQLINPAVQLLVEENGKVFYKGWAFQKYPGLYAFEHADYGLELLDSIPADVS